MIRSALVFLFTWLYMLVAGVPGLIWTLVTRSLGFIYAEARLGIHGLLLLAGVRIEVFGRENLPPSSDVAAVFMSNHQSNLDPPILIAMLPGHVSFIAKKELFSVPVLGAVMTIGGLIPMDRTDRAAAHAGIARAAAAVKRGRPFLIFPEGTRSRDGQLLDFKKGPFYLAEQAQAPVVPITLVGTGNCMPKGAWRILSGAVELHFHPAIRPEQWANAAEPREEIHRLVRAAIEIPLANRE